MSLWVVQVPNPAVGHDWQLTVPGQYLYDVVSVAGDLSTSGGAPSVFVDSSGSGLNATVNVAEVPNMAFDVPGLVAGDGAASITNSVGIMGTAATLPGAFAGQYGFYGWFECDGGATSTQLMFQARTATQFVSQFILNFNQLGFLRRWGPNPTDYDSFSTLPPIALGGVPTFVGVMYDDATDTVQFYIQGQPYGAPQSGSGHPVNTVDATALEIGQGCTFRTTVYDELAFTEGNLSAADFANLYTQASVSFAAYTAAVLFLGPDNYYHMDDFASGGSRQVDLQVTNGSVTVGEIPTGFGLPSSAGPYHYTWQPNLNSSTETPDGAITTVAIPQLFLPAGYTIGTNTLNLAAGDQWSNVVVWWDDVLQQSYVPYNPYAYPPGAFLTYHQQGT